MTNYVTPNIFSGMVIGWNPIQILILSGIITIILAPLLIFGLTFVLKKKYSLKGFINATIITIIVLLGYQGIKLLPYEALKNNLLSNIIYHTLSLLYNALMAFSVLVPMFEPELNLIQAIKKMFEISIKNFTKVFGIVILGNIEKFLLIILYTVALFNYQNNDVLVLLNAFRFFLQNGLIAYGLFSYFMIATYIISTVLLFSLYEKEYKQTNIVENVEETQHNEVEVVEEIQNDEIEEIQHHEKEQETEDK